MSMEQQQPQKPRRSLWERIKIGATGFVTHAVGYIPRGIALTGAIFAGSAVLEGLTGGVGLGVSTWSNEQLIARGLAHLALGSTISGVIGATSDVTCACKEDAGQAAQPSALISRTEQQLGSQLVKGVTDNGINAVSKAATEQFVGSGLPAIANATKNMSIGS
jgi:hypothetical protein